MALELFTRVALRENFPRHPIAPLKDARHF
jgi:hypothetical protein